MDVNLARILWMRAQEIAFWVYSAATGDSSMGVRDLRQGTMNGLQGRKREAVLGMREGRAWGMDGSLWPTTDMEDGELHPERRGRRL